MVTTTVRHPIELLEAFEHNTESSTRISKETNKRQLKNIIATLKRQIDRMQLIFQTSLKIHDIKNDERTTLENEFRATRRQICLSHLDPAFRARYDDEFEDIKGSSDFYVLVNQIIGETNPEDEARDARSKLKDICRRDEEEETFTRFYTRLEKLATTASKGDDSLKKHFLDEAFHSNMTPDLRRYLLDQGKSKQSPKAIAEYLDTMKKHKRTVMIKAVAAEDTLLREQVAALTDQFSNLPEMIKESLGVSLQSLMDRKFDSFRNEIFNVNKVQATTQIPKKQNETQQSYEQKSAIDATTRFTRHQQSNHNDQRPVKQMERHPDGTPITCRGCGLREHSQQNCRGRVICRNCGQRGHIQDICRMPKN